MTACRTVTESVLRRRMSFQLLGPGSMRAMSKPSFTDKQTGGIFFTVAYRQIGIKRYPAKRIKKVRNKNKTRNKSRIWNEKVLKFTYRDARPGRLGACGHTLRRTGILASAADLSEKTVVLNHKTGCAAPATPVNNHGCNLGAGPV